MDLLVPCIVEGRSELRNTGRVNCKTHWPILGCGTPYSLNVLHALQIMLWVFSKSAARLVECDFSYSHFNASFLEALKCLHIFSQLSLSSSYFLPWTAKHLLKWFFVWALPFIFWMKGLARTYNHLVTIVISARMYLSCLHSSLLTTVTHCLQQCTIAFFLFLFL